MEKPHEEIHHQFAYRLRCNLNREGMKDERPVLVLLAMVAGVGVHTMLRDVLVGLARHQAMLRTVIWLVLALACLRHGWPMK